MTENKEALLRTAVPIGFAILVAIVTSLAFEYIPLHILGIGGAVALLVYLFVNLFRMNLDVIKSERALKEKR